MSSTTTITLAEKFMSLIAAADPYRHCETIAPGRYILSDSTAEEPHVAVAVDVVAGVFTWATETLDDMTSEKLEVATASAVLASRFDDATALINCAGNQAGLNIWNRVKLLAARSGYMATLHNPSTSEGAEAAVAV